MSNNIGYYKLLINTLNKNFNSIDIFQDFSTFNYNNCTSNKSLGYDNNYHNCKDIKTDWRFGKLEFDFIDPLLPDPFKDLKKTVSSAILKRQSSSPTLSPNLNKNSIDMNTVSTPIAKFYPSAKEGTVDLDVGTVHLFRDLKSLNNDVDNANNNTNNNNNDNNNAIKELEIIRNSSNNNVNSFDNQSVVGVLAVPSSMSPSDFLEFIRPALDAISHLRIIRDSQPNRSIILIKFRDGRDAIEFREMYDGQPFSSIDKEICRVVHISSVEIRSLDENLSSYSNVFPSDDGWIGNYSDDFVELPTCPVCLDRMDSTSTGLMTIPCNHTFHCSCLSAWPNSRCPVCRYSLPKFQPSPMSSANVENNITVCATCKTTNDLWVCLICGHVGCGRYGPGHAYRHFEQTCHLFSLELETQRVWDYAGDGYVHRLIQKSDGKVVELPSSSSQRYEDEKIPHEGSSKKINESNDEILALEFSSLLASQLDSQRAYYEEKQSSLLSRIDSLEIMIEDQRNVSERENELRNESVKLEKKLNKSNELLQSFKKQIDEEKFVSRGLLERIDKLLERDNCSQSVIRTLESENRELKENVRDLMFFVEARDKVANESRELEGGSIVIPKGQKDRSQQNQKQSESLNNNKSQTTSTNNKSKKKKKKKTNTSQQQAKQANDDNNDNDDNDNNNIHNDHNE